ncbi:MAG: homoserine O-succinyltransferase [Polyangiales bacterium]
MSVLRVGVINLMPEAERYEAMLSRVLGRAAFHLPDARDAKDAHAVQPVWIRLRDARYASSDHDHLARTYRSFGETDDDEKLDGLIVTGAPVETLPYEDVFYFRELATIAGAARTRGLPTLGLCWGGLALGKLLGIEKVRYAQKLFGVYPLRMRDDGSTVHCAQSRHAGIDDAVLEHAEARGEVRLLAHGAQSGYSVFESADGLWTAHLGHPEYELARLVFEYRRDRAAGRTDVIAPVGVDLTDPPRAPETHGPRFFAAWLAKLGARRA